ncbi:MAG: hypothetical protein ACRDD7_13065 [Peptostreptococcaceae bacterium]
MQTHIEKLEILKLVEDLENIKKLSPSSFNKLRAVMIAMADSANKIIESKYIKNLEILHSDQNLIIKFLSEFTVDEIAEALNTDLNTANHNLLNIKFSKKEINILCSKYPTSLDQFIRDRYKVN